LKATEHSGYWIEYFGFTGTGHGFPFSYGFQ
jgi:hypothetical protein